MRQELSFARQLGEATARYLVVAALGAILFLVCATIYARPWYLKYLAVFIAGLLLAGVVRRTLRWIWRIVSDTAHSGRQHA